MGFKSFISDVFKKILVNLITIVILIVGVFLIYKWFIAKLFF